MLHIPVILFIPCMYHAVPSGNFPGISCGIPFLGIKNIPPGFFSGILQLIPFGIFFEIPSGSPEDDLSEISQETLPVIPTTLSSGILPGIVSGIVFRNSF